MARRLSTMKTLSNVGIVFWLATASLLAQTGTAPSINSGGIVNGASFTLTSSSLAPGSIAAIFGSNLTNGTVCVPPNCGPTFDSNGKVIPTLAGAQVTFNGIAAPILSTPGPTQLNVQIPVELAGAASATVQVTVNGQTSAPSTVSLTPLSPGLISVNSSGSGQGAILNDKDANQGIQSLVAPAGSAPNAHPAAVGDVIEIYGTGLGAVTPPVPTGMRPQGPSAPDGDDADRYDRRDSGDGIIFRAGQLLRGSESGECGGACRDACGQCRPGGAEHRRSNQQPGDGHDLRHGNHFSARCRDLSGKPLHRQSFPRSVQRPLRLRADLHHHSDCRQIRHPDAALAERDVLHWNH